MIAPARRVALAALIAVDDGAELPEVLARSRDELTDERDRALAAAIVIGTIRWRARLDFLLQRQSSRPLQKLDAVVLQILRASLFQLLFLERVPASAVVDDAASLTRRTGKTSAAGFVNGVLRSLSRSRGHLDLPAAPASIETAGDREAAIDALAVTGSHPRWLVARWIDRLDLAAATAWVHFNNEEAPLTLRVNRRRASRETMAERLGAAGVDTVPTRFAPDGLVVVSGNPLRTPLSATGDFLIQDEASQLVPLVVGAQPGHRVLDACAAPGGKSLALADALGSDGLLVAADARERRTGLLRQLIDTHTAGARVVTHDLEVGAPFPAIFDRVLVDAPCTGLGTIRRDVDIRWRRSEDDVHRAAARQQRFLANAAKTVGPGGRLVYATCSSEPEENEAVMEAFLASHPDFSPVPRERLIADGVPEVLLRGSTLVTRPDAHRLECFFAAALERR
jgi:16S rRNA (cytosine967-C5)-methyltransferase